MYGMAIADVFDTPARTDAAVHAPAPTIPVDLLKYEEIIVFFSGGKDSVACVLYLLSLGVEPSRIELHHHAVDGKEGSTLMDWPVTSAYCQAFANAFGLRYVETWKVGGFEGELLRENAGTAPVAIPMPSGEYVRIGGERSKANTRMKFPQVSANLQVRWCSSVVKIEVGARYLNTVERFRDGRKRLVVTGERAEESAARANYAVFEPHRCDNRGGRFVDRWLDHWRAVHQFTEQQVWDLLRAYRVLAHPSYFVGLGRASCRYCIFGGPNQWATMQQIDPQGFATIAQHERRFGITIHRSRSVEEQASRGVPLAGARTAWAAIAMSPNFDLPILMDEWVMPCGAFGENAGPT